MYLLFFLILLFFSLRYYKNPQENSFKYARTISLLFFIGIAGLRYNLGIDYFTYEYYFQNCDTLTKFFEGKHKFHYEPLFDITCMTLRTLHINSQLCFLMFSTISSIVLFRVINKFVERRFFFLSLLIYFCFVYLLLEMHALRQSIAATFIYIAYLHVLKRQKLTAAIFVIFAFLFHSSALMILLFVPFLDKKIRPSFQLFLLFFSVLIMLLRIRWLYYILLIIPTFIPDTIISSRLLNFIINESLSHERRIFITFFIYLLLYLYIYKANFLNRGYYASRNNIIAQNIFLMFLICTACFWEFNFFSTRLGWYLLFGFVVILPQITQILLPRQRCIALTTIIIFCLIPFRKFVIPDDTTIMMVPYEGYIECKYLGKESTGKERAIKYAANHDVVFKY